MPALEALAKDLAGRATVVKVDIDRLMFVDRTIRKRFNITALPLYLVYKDGTEVARLSGADQTAPDQIREAVNAALGTAEDETPTAPAAP